MIPLGSVVKGYVDDVPKSTPPWVSSTSLTLNTTPCSGPGAGFSQTGSGQYLATPPLTGPYQGLAVFADRGNTAPLRFAGSGVDTFTGTIYARQGAMELTSGDVALALDSLIVVGTLEVSASAEVLLSFVPANNAVTSSWGANLTK